MHPTRGRAWIFTLVILSTLRCLQYVGSSVSVLYGSLHGPGEKSKHQTGRHSLLNSFIVSAAKLCYFGDREGASLSYIQFRFFTPSSAI